MLLGLLTLLVMAVVAYCFWREGLLTATAMTVNVFAAGVVAFNAWEPLAGQLEPAFADSFLHGYEDALCLVGLFALTLVLLRLLTNKLVPSEPEYYGKARQVGSALLGLVAGYLAAGFLACVLQTLPLPADFLGFSYRAEERARVLPPDHVWLALMHAQGFDPNGTFEERYGRFRRLPGGGDAPPPYQGEAEP
jgi:hypothetical protein